jgi:hypothetical protein
MKRWKRWVCTFSTFGKKLVNLSREKCQMLKSTTMHSKWQNFYVQRFHRPVLAHGRPHHASSLPWIGHASTCYQYTRSDSIQHVATSHWFMGQWPLHGHASYTLASETVRCMTIIKEMISSNSEHFFIWLLSYIAIQGWVCSVRTPLCVLYVVLMWFSATYCVLHATRQPIKWHKRSHSFSTHGIYRNFIHTCSGTDVRVAGWRWTAVSLSAGHATVSNDQVDVVFYQLSLVRRKLRGAPPLNRRRLNVSVYNHNIVWNTVPCHILFC